jgi:nitrogen fixation/metabolism regulation signal transduction histidine kinase
MKKLLRPALFVIAVLFVWQIGIFAAISAILSTPDLILGSIVILIGLFMVFWIIRKVFKLVRTSKQY